VETIARGEARIALAMTTAENAGAIGDAIRRRSVHKRTRRPIGRAQGRPRSPLRPGTVAETQEASGETANRRVQARRALVVRTEAAGIKIPRPAKNDKYIKNITK